MKGGGNNRLAAHLVILVLLLAAHIVYLCLPSEWAEPFTFLCRPVLYAGAVVSCLVFWGRGDGRTDPRRRGAQIALSSVILYVMAILMAGVLFGFGKNAMAPEIAQILKNTWIYATIAVMSEILRFHIIAGSQARHRAPIAVALTLVYAFVQLDTLRTPMNMNAYAIAGLFFTAVFPALALHSVLSFMALEGSWSLLVMRCAYSLIPAISPVLPNVSTAVWSVASCTFLFVTVIAYHRMMDAGSARTRRLAKRRAKLQKTPSWLFLVPVSFVALLAVFILRGFSVYPVVVLTGSMEGAIDPGAIVFVQKLPPGDVYNTVQEGDIIQFTYRDREVMHRVSEYRDNASGARTYITKGDANPAADANPVEGGQILGIAKAYIPYLGYPFLLLNTISQNR